MRIAACGLRMGVAVVVWALGPAPAPGQSLAQRVADAPDGVVRFAFAARPGVTGDGPGNIRRRDDDWHPAACDTGPVRVTLTLRDGTVRTADVTVGADRSGDGTDLGRVPPAEATRYLLALARSAPERVGREAVLAAALADSVT